MSQAELARLAGFKTQSGIGNIESRKDGRGGFSLGKIAAALNVPVEWLLDGPDGESVPMLNASGQAPLLSQRAESSVQAFTEVDRAIAAIRRLPPKGVKEALQYLEFLDAKFNSPSQDGAGHPVPAPASKAA